MWEIWRIAVKDTDDRLFFEVIFEVSVWPEEMKSSWVFDRYVGCNSHFNSTSTNEQQTLCVISSSPSLAWDRCAECHSGHSSHVLLFHEIQHLWSRDPNILGSKRLAVLVTSVVALRPSWLRLCNHLFRRKGLSPAFSLQCLFGLFFEFHDFCCGNFHKSSTPVFFIFLFLFLCIALHIIIQINRNTNNNNTDGSLVARTGLPLLSHLCRHRHWKLQLRLSSLCLLAFPLLLRGSGLPVSAALLAQRLGLRWLCSRCCCRPHPLPGRALSLWCEEAGVRIGVPALRRWRSVKVVGCMLFYGHSLFLSKLFEE